ncbi:hypothetical protein Lfu02_48760 [Longispora fulva]|uniref:GNAT superfamily N-acetyltransferase n=1 Tax=Longispora fulva TaxID=619741 RepID=A0A8J7KR69_9ACTN|nr:GNAT family N-acetyltransferase [Longispora fulva]MBG6138252.1 GNAT superfamily N-acetyltransferase [Longispora fulva]GIG60504.1 hypothetical protein Lfu02_48760 [Longispora fulva]
MTNWQSTVLGQEHDLTKFDCGNALLTTWLHRDALRSQAAGAARTFVWTDGDDPAVVAFYSLAPTRIMRDEVTGGLAGGYSQIPGYLIARLALDRSLHGQGLGSELLFDAIGSIVRAAETGGGRLIVVDAIDDAAFEFYRHHNFKAVDGGVARRLYMKIATARKEMRISSLDMVRDPETGLVATTIRRPDGSVSPLVIDPQEAKALGEAFLNRAAQAVPGARVSFDDIILEVLGRDPRHD